MKHVYSSYTRNTASIPCFPPIFQYKKHKRYHNIIDNDFHCQLMCKKSLATNRGNIVPVLKIGYRKPCIILETLDLKSCETVA